MSGKEILDNLYKTKYFELKDIAKIALDKIARLEEDLESYYIGGAPMIYNSASGEMEYLDGPRIPSRSLLRENDVPLIREKAMNKIKTDFINRILQLADERDKTALSEYLSNKKNYKFASFCLKIINEKYLTTDEKEKKAYQDQIKQRDDKISRLFWEIDKHKENYQSKRGYSIDVSPATRPQQQNALLSELIPIIEQSVKASEGGRNCRAILLELLKAGQNDPSVSLSAGEWERRAKQFEASHKQKVEMHFINVFQEDISRKLNELLYGDSSDNSKELVFSFGKQLEEAKEEKKRFIDAHPEGKVRREMKN